MQGTMTTEEVVRRGQEIYDRDIRSRVEPHHNGLILVVDINSGEFEIDDSMLAACDRMRDRHPDSILYSVRIGSPYVYRIGGSAKRTEYERYRLPSQGEE